MKKLLLIAVVASGLVACTQAPAPKEDSKLKEAYSACINTAEGNPDKIQACQSVLDVLKEEKQHQAFANRKACAFSIINSVFRRPVPVMIRRLKRVAIASGKRFAATTRRNKTDGRVKTGEALSSPVGVSALMFRRLISAA